MTVSDPPYPEPSSSSSYPPTSPLSFVSGATALIAGYSGSETFTDFALSGSFESGKVYYLRFQIHQIPKYFYSGSKTAA